MLSASIEKQQLRSDVSSGPRVLIADDSESIRELLRLHFTRWRWQIAGEAENGAQAVTMFKELRPDLVTLDIIMPAIDGIDALAAFRVIKKMAAEVPILVVSTVPNHVTRETFMSEGAFAHLVKPFNRFYFDEVMNKLRMAFPKFRSGLQGRIRGG